MIVYLVYHMDAYLTMLVTVIYRVYKVSYYAIERQA